MSSTHYTVSGNGPKLIVTFSILTGITTIAIALRVYVRGWMVKNFGMDDWTAIVGWMAYVGLASTAMASTYHGFGQHAYLIQPPSEIEIGLKLTWSSELMYATSNMIIKLSICFALLRFVIEPIHKTLLYMIVASTSISSIVFFFVFIFQCIPVSFFWTRSQGNTDGKCLNPVIVVMGTYIYSVISVLCDWSMAILPWILVRKMKMVSREKILVTFVLAMGSIASVASIGRLAYVKRLADTDDLLYQITGVAIWSACETGLGLFASCVATLRPLLKNTRTSRRRVDDRQQAIQMPDVTDPSRKVKRPRMPWSDLLYSDAENTEYTLESSEQSQFSNERTFTESRHYNELGGTYEQFTREQQNSPQGTV